MFRTLRVILAQPPVRVALAMSAITIGLNSLASIAKEYRQAVDERRAELAALDHDLAVRNVMAGAPITRTYADESEDGPSDGVA